MGEQGSGELRYTAFLSYSHRNAAAAAKLHRRLEAYRMPKRLVGQETARGPVPERLAPIFRDREELPASSDLSETVRAALAESGALIVLCSPAAAESPWVAEEIRVFRELHPGRPVLAAVLEGDPPDCFPDALRAFGRDGTWHEPLATDLRPHCDGWRLGLLKLVAGITSVGLDALVQRDAQRRIRRVTAVTAAAVIAMLVMAALAVVAVRARQEAERQRAEAEGLVEFMLTDLREKLREVGRIDIMRPVNERALAHLDRQLQSRDRPAVQLMRARVFQAIGTDDITRGDLPAALAAFRQASRLTADQLARDPNDPQRLLDHAHSEYWIGRVYEIHRDWPIAERQYRRFAAITDRLIAVAPNDPDHMMEVAWSALDLGNVQLNGTRDYPAAQRSYEKAIHWFGRAARARPQDQAIVRAEANAYGWLADSFFNRRLWRPALAARMRQLELAERQYRADPANAESNFRYALALRGAGSTLLRVPDPGNRERGRALLFQAFDWSRRLTRHDPDNAEWQLFRAFIDCELYYVGLGWPPGESRAGLARDIRAVDQALRAQRNPRAGEFANCVNHLSDRPAPGG